MITWLLVPVTMVSGGIAHQFQTSMCSQGAEQIWMPVTSGCVFHGWRQQEQTGIKGTENSFRRTENSAELDP